MTDEPRRQKTVDTILSDIYRKNALAKDVV